MKSRSLPFLQEYRSQLEKQHIAFASEMTGAYQSLLAQLEAQHPGLTSAQVTGVSTIRLSFRLKLEPPLPALQKFLLHEQEQVISDIHSVFQGSSPCSVKSEGPNAVLMLPRSEVLELDRITDNTMIVNSMLCSLISMVDNVVPESQDFHSDIEILFDLPDPRGMKKLRYIESKGRVTYETTKLPTVTIDTNVIREWWDNRNRWSYVDLLLNSGKDGELDIAVTNRIYDDIENLPLAAKINSLSDLSIHNVGSVIRISRWRVGADSVGVTEFYEFLHAPEIVEEFNQMNPRSRPDWRDWDHLHTHYRYGRDCFLTWDKKILHFSDQLQDQLGIIVMKPEEYLQDN